MALASKSSMLYFKLFPFNYINPDFRWHFYENNFCKGFNRNKSSKSALQIKLSYFWHIMALAGFEKGTKK